ncbi:MAG: Threonine efflux protein [Alphaproteobacteria bacterium]|jgi:threonine/homoserine/homoserine lactone efflux protein|nr:Threonine efflux protein [Alphaproteobacteria bacterium]
MGLFNLISWADFLGFTLTAAAIVASPGPDTMLILRNSFIGGKRVGLYTVAGVQLGLLGHTLMAVLGLAALLAASPIAFKIIAICGALYLAFLGIQTLRGGIISGDPTQGGGLKVTAASAVRDATFTNLLNPKVILLFLALMPQFVDTSRGHVSLQMLVFSAWLLIINVIWQSPLALLAEFMRRVLLRPSAQRAVNWLTGAILLFFAGLLLYDYIA